MECPRYREMGLLKRRGALKDVLDLLEEFCKLNEVRIESRGRLPQRSENRWEELKSLYDRLMSRDPSARKPGMPTFVAEDIRERLKHRERLRVPTDMEVFFRYKDTYLSSRLVNLSRGGLFLGSSVLLAEGAQITVYLPNLGDDYEDIFETRGEVAWTTRGSPQSGIPRGMGVRFRELSGSAKAQLDTLLIRKLQARL